MPDLPTESSEPTDTLAADARPPTAAPQTATPTDPAPGPDPRWRLPYAVEPHVYRLELAPDIGRATFAGSVAIDLTLHEPATQVICNAAELTISEARLVTAAGDARVARWTFDEVAEQVTFHFDEVLSAGSATLHVRFDGVLNDRLRGFHRVEFTDPSGRHHTIATTQLQSTDARRAFPCWDEPDRKAVFETTLVVDEALAAFSNSEVVAEESLGDGRRVVRFAPTMKMSTYLVAFVVGPFETTPVRDVGGVPVRVVYLPGQAHLTGFALEVADHALRFFTDYFEIAYPGDKLDLVAIPDFSWGAMENLGCVTFRETALLVDPATAARVELERVADVVCHELAHMWFGDLVTMGWWEGFWLNEAFATLMELLAVDAFRPSWQRFTTFGVTREGALAIDGLHTTRPIEFPVHSPAEAEGMADALTYQKGAGVLRMLEQYVGPTTFRDGVRRYLRRHAYANTVTRDLWRALSEASGEDVGALMDSFILQGGHPVVSIEPGGPADPWLLHQRPFSYTSRPPEVPRAGDAGLAAGGGAGLAAGGEATAAAPSAIGARWTIPVALRTLPRRAGTGATDGTDGTNGTDGANGTDGTDRTAPETADAGSAAGRVRRVLLDGPTAAIEPPAGPAVLNAGGWGIYRSAYATSHLLALGARLDELDALERSQLYYDTWALVLAGETPLADLLSLADALGAETEPAPWSVVVQAVSLCHRIADAGDRPAVAAACRSLLGPRLDQLTFVAAAGEDERTPSLRALLLRTLGTVGHDEVVRAEAARRFDDERGGGEPLDPDLALAVLDVVADQCRPGDYDAMAEQYRAAPTPQQELRALYALVSFPDPTLAERTFFLCLRQVRAQDAPFVLARFLATPVVGPVAWHLLKEHWDEALQRFPLNNQCRMLEGVSGLCADAALAADVTGFLAAHPLEVGPRRVAQSVERLAVNRGFAERYGRSLDTLLRGGAPLPPP
jgi:puromycin-sensitive aminopeptidase